MDMAIKLRRILGRLRNAGAAVLVLAGFICARQAVADPAITPGSADGALQYYQKVEKFFEGLKLTNGLTPLDDVATFLGYQLSGAKLESLDPAVLMSPQAGEANGGLGLGPNDASGARFRDGDILASRFFAPKIMDVTASTAPVHQR